MSAPVTDAHALTERAPATAALPPRHVWPAIACGVRSRCPAFGEGKMFRTCLKVNDKCPSCGEELCHHRTDDFPPYLTIVIAGHIVGSLLVLTEERWPDAPFWLRAVIWRALIALSLCPLLMVKGRSVAYQWAFRMHGFEKTGRPEPAGQSGCA